MMDKWVFRLMVQNQALVTVRWRYLPLGRWQSVAPLHEPSNGHATPVGGVASYKQATTNVVWEERTLLAVRTSLRPQETESPRPEPWDSPDSIAKGNLVARGKFWNTQSQLTVSHFVNRASMSRPLDGLMAHR
jgi:hypothetical protein